MTVEEALKKLRRLNDTHNTVLLAVVPNEASVKFSPETGYRELWDVVDVSSKEVYKDERDNPAWLYGRAATIPEAVEQAEAKLKAMRS